MHSTFSDGALTPEQLMKRCKDLELDLVSLTDHDGIGGLERAARAAKDYKIGFIPGIELSTVMTYGEMEDVLGEELFERGFGTDVRMLDDIANYRNKVCVEIHMLGYRFDPKDPILLEKLAKIRKGRIARNNALIEVLQKQGIDITIEDCITREDQDYIGKPNMAMALARKGYVETPRDAFEDGKFLQSEEAMKLEKYILPTVSAIEIIGGSGGTSVFAHPIKTRGIKKLDKELRFEIIWKLAKFLKTKGLKGMECYHPSANNDDAIRLVGFAEKLHLHITKGSDFHGKALR